MRALIVSDIHGNLPALEAVLAAPAAQACERVISLGDHINFGPESRAVQRRLEELHALMLMGNHEERLGHMGDFAGYNWALLRWTAGQLAGMNHDFPVDARLGPVWLTHGTPGNPYSLIHKESFEADLRPVLAALPDGVTHLLSGHNHIQWTVVDCGRTAFNPGSVGIPEDGIGGVAPFAVMELADDGTVALTRHQVMYDLKQAGRAFLETGAAQAAPQMCRAVYQSMRTGAYQGVTKIVRRLIRVAEAHGLSFGDEEAWRIADAEIPWLEPLSTRDFWRRMEEVLA